MCITNIALSVLGEREENFGVTMKQKILLPGGAGHLPVLRIPHGTETACIPEVLYRRRMAFGVITQDM